jgi:glyoxylase-like metal-dependent hydrolase (beta-lactamase superfamily II)
LISAHIELNLAPLLYNQNFNPAHGQSVNVANQVKRITAPNQSPMTFTGTNSYLVGKDNLALIDPGPLIDSHLQTLIDTIDGRPLTHIFVSHTHKDHSPLAAKLKEITGATIYAEGPHRAARDLFIGEVNPLHESSDKDFVPDVHLTDGQIIDGGDWQIKAIHTPGHTANHCAFELMNDFAHERLLFSADHIMAWSTSIVAPPDGSMRDFMLSLDKLIDCDHHHIFPGHGGDVIDPPKFLSALRLHRLFRERSIVRTLEKNGALTIDKLVDRIYIGLSPQLKFAASLSVLAHLEDLVSQNRVSCEGMPSLLSAYEIYADQKDESV